ncbi:energy transducer TonB [Dysgonomonas macrotermitis]|uniref:TonB family C-terminal domain-containing protein n=1 Tax=Dysgonomonas macrotermitis TaxID=1346286 RepID=A0A1M4UGY9_9BACT|nr:energy transducer TonB [Dysgonomonas macrotermitis]SHE55908.1 TonB family C-terminal domain-containing protein [Dysgonomonas macrotermitis]
MALIKQEKTIGLAGTIGFHVLLIIFLLLYYIKPSNKDRLNDELGGVPVMFGNVQDALGDDEPFGRGNGLTEDVLEPIESDPTMPNNLEQTEAVTKTEPIPAPTTPAAKPVVKDNKAPTATQDVEKTIAISEAKKQEAAKKQQEAVIAEAKKKAQVEADRKAQEEADRKKNINSQMAGLFGNGSGNGSRGNTHGTGTQGSPAGNGNVGKVSGVGGTGTYDLGGRGVGSGGLKLPAYTVDDYGTVVVDIIVDPKGNVIEASIGRGTNTTNSTLRNESIRAAQRTKFALVNTTNNQKGTITYKFNLN